MNRYIKKKSNRNIQSGRKAKPEMSEAECKLWAELRTKQMGVNFERKVPLGPYILDFYSSKAKLVIQMNRKRRDAEEGRQKDAAFDEYLKKEGLSVLRFSGPEALASINGVLQRIWLRLNKKDDEPL